MLNYNIKIKPSHIKWVNINFSVNWNKILADFPIYISEIFAISFCYLNIVIASLQYQNELEIKRKIMKNELVGASKKEAN